MLPTNNILRRPGRLVRGGPRFLGLACALLLLASAEGQAETAPTTPKPNQEFAMTMFKKQTVESAPEASRGPMTRLRESAGVLPNLAAMMSESPTLIDGFVTLREIYQRASLNAKEREILGLSNAVANGCDWCVAFHSFVAVKLGIDRATIDAIRAGTPPADLKARALNKFTTRLIERRGAVSEEDLKEFTQAGFTKQQALEVVAGLALSLMANYAGNFVEPELDPFLRDLAWTKGKAAH